MQSNRFRHALALAVCASLLLPAAELVAGSRHSYHGYGYRGSHGFAGGYHGHRGYRHSSWRVGGYYSGWNDRFWWGVGIPLGVSLAYSAAPVYRTERVRVIEQSPPPAPQPAAVVYQNPPKPSPEELMLARARQIERGAPPARPEPVSWFGLTDVRELTEQGLGDAVIIAQIRQSGVVFRLTTQQLIDLKAVGVSEPVIAALIDTAAPPVAE